MPKIIGVVQVKGGAGRSTVSTNLAGELSKLGKTILIDCDQPQGTAASWYAVRSQLDKTGQLHADTASSNRELVAKVEKYASADYIVLDGPPRIAELTRAILVLSDMCLVPVGASAAEIWATSDLMDLIREAEAVGTVNARMIWTRYRSNTKLAKTLSELASAELGMVAMKVTLGMRVSYVQALGEGLTAAELPDTSAQAESRFLINETLSILKGKK